MTPERWQQIETLFHSALARTGDERESFLDSACAHDQELRREVEALLASHDEAGSFIQSPALDLMAEEMANDQARALAGRLINHYKILSQLGAGGMGEVYLAQESKTGRRVALKLLPEHFTSDGERVRRFQQEAHAVLALNHPNILTIYEIGEAGGSYYIATEFIDGETLRAHMARAPVKLEEALDVAAQVASALTEAHAAGIVHRDIKPENIMIRRDGYVKVLDFGIAKLTERQQPLTTAEAPTRLKVKTDPGMVMGTVAYMSPEQARGASVDERTDIWSLGCVLYEMIAGRVPFEGESAGDTISMILDKQPPTLARYAPESPQEIQWVVNRALRKNKEERYQTVKELLGDLRELKQELEVQARIERSTSPEADAEATAAAGGARQPVMTATAASARSDGADVRTTSSAEYLIDGIRRHKRGFALAALMVLLVAAVGVGYWFLVRHSSNASQIQSIAVLPFVNASGNPDVEYLSDGMTESLINNLSQLPKLSVKARSSVFRYKGREVEPQQIAGELSVQAVLNGRVVQHGDNLSLSLELVDARNGNLIWGEQYNRKLTDLVSLQGEIARDVSNKLRARLSGAEEKSVTKNYTQNTEAYQLYLQGRFYWNKRTLEGFKKAGEYFQQAIEKDPNYALAYVGLADSYSLNEQLSPRERAPKSNAAAMKALELDETLGEAHATLGATMSAYEWDRTHAEAEFRRAIELSPNYATAHHWYGEFLAAQGRFDESFAEYQRAQELDPFSMAIASDLGYTYYYARQYDRAIEHLKKSIEVDPNYWRTHYYLAKVYQEKEMFDEAEKEFEKNLVLVRGNMEEFARDKALINDARKKSGTRGYWRKIIELMERDAKKSGTPPYTMEMARHYARLNERDEAFAWLEKAYGERHPALTWLKVAPEWDNLRSDPRFADLLRRVGLWQ